MKFCPDGVFRGSRLCRLVHAPDDVAGGARGGRLATNGEAAVTGDDLDTETGFDLAQVCIKLSAEGSQITGVIGFEGQA